MKDQHKDDTTLTTEVKYHINFTQSGKIFVLKSNICINFFVNATKVYQFKAQYSEMKDYALCLGNVWKDFTFHNMK